MKQTTFLPALLNKIGKRLRNIRTGRGEKLTSVETGIGLDHSIISRIENGRYHCLRFDTLVKLACYYEIDLHDLLAP